MHMNFLMSAPTHMHADAHMKALSHTKNNTRIHTAAGSSSASYITRCQTSIFIEVSSFNERHALPAAVLVSLAVNLPSPSGKTYSKMLCQFVALHSFNNGVWSKCILTSACFFFVIYLFFLVEILCCFKTNTCNSLYRKMKCTDVCAFESVVSGRGREP